jgi:DNA-binding winged helix-turn-helix (wHTH) protein/tetratricopeptide (TPR) repeat protein
VKSFHSFRLDAINHCLWRGEERVPLGPKAFDLLRYLVDHANRVVPQAEILEALWSKSYVNPELVKKYILGIRKVLGDRRDKPVFIETVQKRGYKFVAPVRDESASIAPGSADGNPTRIVGRHTARAELDTCLERALQGIRQVFFVTGEAGAGKTALIDAFQHHAALRSNPRIARGQCIEVFGGKEAYYPMLEAVGQLIRSADASPVLQTLAKHAPTWMIQFPALLSLKQKEALQREVLGTMGERMVREICEALESMTAAHPLLLILEDLHWADAATLGVISALARRRGPAKLMILATCRTEAIAGTQNHLKSLKQDLLIHRLCQECELQRLTQADVSEYLAAEFPASNLPVGLARLVHHHSGGNPLFMVTIVRDFVRNGFLAEHTGKWTLTKPLDEIEPGVPPTLQQMLEVQLDQLNAEEQEALKFACVLGESFSAWTIANSVGSEPDRIEQLCEGLTESRRFIRSAGIQELPDGTVSAHYEFGHSLYRAFLYGRLSAVTRARLHRSVAQQLETLYTPDRQELAPTLALHFEHGREYGRAIHYLILTAEIEARRFAHGESIELLQHALDMVPRVAAADRTLVELRVLERIGDVHYALGSMSESASAYEMAATRAAQAGLAGAHAHALICQAPPLGLIDPDRAVAAVERAVQVIADDAEGDALHARARFMAAVLRLLYDRWRDGDWETCSALAPKVCLPNERCLSEHDEMFYAYVQCLRGNFDESARAAGEKMRETKSLMGYLGAVGVKMLALLFLGEFGQVLEIIREGRAMAEKSGYDPWLFVFREAWLHTLCFDFAGARLLCEALMRSREDVPSTQPQTIARLSGGYIELEHGRYDQAARCFDEIRDHKATPKFFLHWYWRMQAQIGLTQVSLASGNLATARAEAAGLLESALRTAEPTLHAQAWEIKARVAIAAELEREARECIQQALSIVERRRVPLAAWRVHATAWELSHKVADYAAAESHCGRAASGVLLLANSLGPGEAMRNSFLAAAPVSRVLARQPNGLPL